MIGAFLQLFGGLVLLFLGAEGLVRGAAAIALRMGVSALVVGLTVVAFGTSCPELLVCLKGALAGKPGLAVGNAVGSNIFNLAAILGVVALIHPIRCHSAIILKEIPVMIAVTFLFAGLVAWGGRADPGEWSGRLTRAEGIVLLALLVLYVGGGIYFARRATARTRKAFAEDVTIGEPATVVRATPLWLCLFLVVGGGALLTLGADLMVDGAIYLGTKAGMSELVIGLTIVGGGTGLPELATSITAAFRKEPDIALGNVVGSCVFNLLGILGITAIVHPLDTVPMVLLRDVPIMIVVSLVVLPMAFTDYRISRAEGSVLLAGYIGYIVYLMIRS